MEDILYLCVSAVKQDEGHTRLQERGTLRLRGAFPLCDPREFSIMRNVI